ncbi:MAG: RtcB family protein [Candidatus Parvarchaeota archaeon]|nr:RtcB family protein [Candidatus Parvarchaeota archaeon]
MEKEFKRPTFHKVSDTLWEISKDFKKGMLVPTRIYAAEKLLKEMDPQVFDQVSNMATLPGIEKYAFVMPDGHAGYGSPIGGVAAFDINRGGVISPGVTGYDINCGMRLVLTDMTVKDVRPKIKELTDTLFKKVPAGVGSKSDLNLSKKDFKDLSEEGAKWAIRKGYGWKDDISSTELEGKAEYADFSKISDMVISRGIKQIGTLGSGNHYLEIQYVNKGDIKDERLAKKWGIFPGQVVIMFHTGSRGAGHQIASDYIKKFLDVMDNKYGIKISDRELACAPFNSKDGQDYYKAMGCGINISFANRQLILYRVREAFSEVFKKDAEKLGLRQLFDIAHNRASLEKHDVDGETKELLVHRKGSTGSYPPGRKEIPKNYRNDGSPVIIGGSMETGSYLMVGGPNASETFDSTAHGSGRTMSRTKARGLTNGEELFKKMLKNGIYVKSVSWSGLAEESGESYKNLEEVVDTVDKAGLSKRVCRLTPLSNVKG